MSSTVPMKYSCSLRLFREPTTMRPARPRPASARLPEMRPFDTFRGGYSLLQRARDAGCKCPGFVLEHSVDLIAHREGLRGNTME
jgi:hypothetical protein